MKTALPLYLVTYCVTYRGVALGNRSARTSGETASEALARFHRSMQLRKACGPHDYRVIGFCELDRTRRTVVSRLAFPPGPNPRIETPAARIATPANAAAQMFLAI